MTKNFGLGATAVAIQFLSPRFLSDPILDEKGGSSFIHNRARNRDEGRGIEFLAHFNRHKERFIESGRLKS